MNMETSVLQVQFLDLLSNSLFGFLQVILKFEMSLDYVSISYRSEKQNAKKKIFITEILF